MPTKTKPKKPKTKPKPKKTKPKQKQKQKQTTNVRQIVNINRPVRKRVVYGKRPFQIAPQPVMNMNFQLDGMMNQNNRLNFINQDTLEAAVRQAAKAPQPVHNTIKVMQGSQQPVSQRASQPSGFQNAAAMMSGVGNLASGVGTLTGGIGSFVGSAGVGLGLGVGSVLSGTGDLVRATRDRANW
jgi:hypothetical protein